jgi:hypothetical protein
MRRTAKAETAHANDDFKEIKANLRKQAGGSRTGGGCDSESSYANQGQSYCVVDLWRDFRPLECLFPAISGFQGRKRY